MKINKKLKKLNLFNKIMNKNNQKVLILILKISIINYNKMRHNKWINHLKYFFKFINNH